MRYALTVDRGAELCALRTAHSVALRDAEGAVR